MWWLLLGCGPSVVIEVSPAEVDLGTVDFAVEMPEEGYNPTAVTLTNVGTADTTITVTDDDPDHLCLQGFSTFDAPYDLGDIPAGGSYTFEIAACGQLQGEMDTEVATEVRLSASGGDPVVVPVRFLSVRSIDDGTAD